MTTQAARTGVIWLTVFAAALVLVFIASMPFGYGPLVVGLVTLGLGIGLRRREAAMARLAQILGALMVAVGLVIMLLGMTASTGSGGDTPPSPRQVPVERP
jgi:hypothetical protein